MNSKHLPLPTVVLVAVVFAILGILAWRGVPGTAVAVAGGFTTLIAALMRGLQSDDQIVRNASLRPPPEGPSEIIHISVPSVPPPPSIGGEK